MYSVSNTKIFFQSIDPIHVGTGGYSLGRVDNSIAREPTTGVPKIPGTALSGASRHYSAEIYSKIKNIDAICSGQGPHCGKCPVCYTFGYSRGTGDSYAGTVNIFDAQILLFPVRSIYGTIWVTTRSLLIEAGLVTNEFNQQFPLTINQNWDGKTINLGWRLINNLALESPNNGNLIPDKIRNIVGNKIIVIGEGDFGLIVNGNLEVRTSNAINPYKHTAENRALYTYEAIPRKTIFVMEAIEDNYRRDQGAYFSINGTLQGINGNSKNINWKNPLNVLLTGLKEIEYRGIGGMGTRGFGRLRMLDDASNTGIPSEDEQGNSESSDVESESQTEETEENE